MTEDASSFQHPDELGRPIEGEPNKLRVSDRFLASTAGQLTALDGFFAQKDAQNTDPKELPAQSEEDTVTGKRYTTQYPEQIERDIKGTEGLDTYYVKKIENNKGELIQLTTRRITSKGAGGIPVDVTASITLQPDGSWIAEGASVTGGITGEYAAMVVLKTLTGYNRSAARPQKPPASE